MPRPRMRRLLVLTAAAAVVVGLAMAGSAQAATTVVPQATTTPAAPGPSAPLGAQEAVGVTATDGARVLSETWQPYGHEVDLAIGSPAVGLYLPVRLILPDGWTPDAKKTWPLVLMLHGGHDTYTSWTRNTDVAALAEHEQLIVAMPDAGYSATYTNYVKPLDGKPYQWETFHTVELMQILQKAFHTNTTRAVFGLSAGGYGSMAYASTNPGMFRFAASFSGPVSLQGAATQAYVMVSDGDDDPYARFGQPVVDQANWDAHDPYVQAAGLRGTDVYLSSGYTGIPSSDDTVAWTWVQLGEAFAGQETASLAVRLATLGIPATVDLYPFGEHTWVNWQMELTKAWPLMLKSLNIATD